MKKVKKISPSPNKLFSILILIATIFMGIGYASINSIVMNINGEVIAKDQDGIFITEVNYVSDGDDINNSYEIFYADETNLKSKIVLEENNLNSEVSLKISFYNNSNSDYIFKDVVYAEELTDEINDVYSNTDIIYTLDNQNEIISKNGGTLDVIITFKYNQILESTSNILNSILNFKFQKIYYITYENFASTVDYPNYVGEGDSLSISFGTLDAPIEVKQSDVILSSDDYNYSNYTLTMNNVNDDIHIRKLTEYTVNNLVTNGSFENGLTEWTLSGSDTNSWKIIEYPHYGSYSAYRSANSEGNNFIMQNIYFTTDHKYYFFGYASSYSTQMFVCDVTNKGGEIILTTDGGSYLKGSTIYTADFTGYNTISINYAQITDNVFVDGIGVVDLTESFGQGNEPSLSWCDSNINYFDDTTVVYK